MLPAVPMSDGRALLLEIWQQALAAVDGRRRVRAALDRCAGGRSLAGHRVGKAAAAMTLGALDALGPQVAHALAISRSGHFPAELESKPQVERRVAGHPLPDMHIPRGRRACSGAARVVARGSAHSCFSFQAAVPAWSKCYADGVSLADLRRVNDWLLAAGYDIAAINSIRKRLSLIKGGRLPGLHRGA